MANMDSKEEHDFVTTISLRINFKDLTFKDSFKRERTTSQSAKPQCHCSRLRDIHPYHSVRDIAQGLKPSDTVTARFVMYSPDNLRKAEKLCTPDAYLNFEHPLEFRFWIISLATLLSDLCQGDHSPKAEEAPPIYGLRPFKEGAVSKRIVCEDIRRLLMSPLTPSERKEHGMGYVYILRSQLGSSTLGELKIGFSKYHPENRAHEIASCYALPEVISHTPYLPHAKRLESIIHAELQADRKIHACRRCKGNHREWFTILHGDSREVVTRWSKWILQQPYVNGNLNEEWKTYLMTKDFSSVNNETSLTGLWQSIMDNFPQKDLAGSESECIAQYLEQCHWDNICTRMGLDDLEQVGCDKCKKYASDWRKLKKYPRLGSEKEMDDAIQNLGHLALSATKDNSCDCDKSSDFDFGFQPRYKNQRMFMDQPLGDWVDKSTRSGRMFHPATPTGYLMRPDRSLGRLIKLIRTQHEEELLAQKELSTHVASLRGIKTGARSVSDARLGKTESPLGDATLLPILARKDLKCLDDLVVNWIGYTPTHSGFQLLQEAYKEGKWFGKTPQFKLPKAYRAAGVDTIPMPGRESRIDTGKDMRDASEGIRPNRKMRNQETSGSNFSLSRGAEYGDESFTFSQTLDDKFKDEVQQMQRICEIPLGRQMIEREFARSLRHVGLDACFGLPDISDESDTDEELGDHSRSQSHSSPRSSIPTKRKTTSNPDEHGITQKNAKRWLGSL